MLQTLSLSLVLDSVILVLLFITIVYAAKLSLYLKRFRDSKSDLEAIITDLSRQITKADNAIKGLNATVRESEEDLQDRMNKARAMYDELEMIVQTGDSMATRLENLAVKNRKILEGGEGDLENLRKITSKTDSNYEDRVKGLVRQAEEARQDGLTEGPPVSPFSIRDPDVERGDDVSSGFELSDDDGDVLSDAERDLYNALKGKKSRAGGRK